MYYNTALTVGNQYDITGDVKLFNGVHEFSNPTSVTAGTGTAPAYGTPETMTVSSLTSYTSAPVTKYAVVHITAPASGYVGTDGTNSVNVYDGTGTWANYYGKVINVTGYLIGYYNSKINMIATAIEEDTTAPTISVSPASLSWAAAEIDSKTLTVTLNGAADPGDYGYSVTSGTAGDWNISNNGSGTITVSPKAANASTTDAKSLTLRISHNGASSTVYQDVTCTQGKASSGTGYTLVANQKITFSESGYTNQQAISSVSGTNWSMSLDKGTNSNAPKYYSSGAAIRCYGGNTFTVTAASGYKIESIKLTFGSSDGSNAITTDIGTYSNGNWAGTIENGGSVTFTVGGTTGNRRLAAIEIN